jgi:hypothetical protein
VGGSADFNPPGPAATGLVQLANDGSDVTTDACSPLVGFVAGRIALVDRGVCSYPPGAERAERRRDQD